MTKTNKKTVKVIATIFVAFGLIFSSCKKDPGPKGDTGSQGPAGPAGTNGTNGINGTNGNANVVSSSITTASWTYVAPSWEMSFTYPAINQDILDNGAVLVYVKSGSNYYQLPYTFYPSSSYSRTYTFVHYLGGLKVFVTDSDLTQPTNPGTLTFKVVAIAASGKMANPNLNYDDYNAVKKAFNLQD